MAIMKTTPSGDTFSIPEAGEVNWSQQVTNILFYVLDAIRNGDTVQTTELVTRPTVLNVANNDILDVTGVGVVLLQSTGNVKLNASSPVLNGGYDGKRLTLICSSDYEICVPDTDTQGNMQINGPCTLRRNADHTDVLELVWIDSVSKWIETSRNN